MIKDIIKAMMQDVYSYYVSRRNSKFIQFTETYYKNMATEDEIPFRSHVIRFARGYSELRSVRDIFNKIADMWEDKHTFILNDTEAAVVRDILGQLRDQTKVETRH